MFSAVMLNLLCMFGILVLNVLIICFPAKSCKSVRYKRSRDDMIDCNYMVSATNFIKLTVALPLTIMSVTGYNIGLSVTGWLSILGIVPSSLVNPLACTFTTKTFRKWFITKLMCTKEVKDVDQVVT